VSDVSQERFSYWHGELIATAESGGCVPVAPLAAAVGWCAYRTLSRELRGMPRVYFGTDVTQLRPVEGAVAVAPALRLLSSCAAWKEPAGKRSW